MLVLDVTDPYNPVEIARYFDDSTAFRESNGSPHPAREGRSPAPAVTYRITVNNFLAGASPTRHSHFTGPVGSPA